MNNTWQPQPTLKHASLDSLFHMIYGKDRVTTIRMRQCMRCDQTDLTPACFRDQQSLMEYHISGLCQTCQDSAFQSE